MKREIQGQRIAITGASSGIGRALVEALAREGARLVLAARDEGKLQELAKSLPGEPLVVPTDVTKDGDRQRLLDRTDEPGGRVYALGNHARERPVAQPPHCTQ